MLNSAILAFAHEVSTVLTDRRRRSLQIAVLAAFTALSAACGGVQQVQIVNPTPTPVPQEPCLLQLQHQSRMDSLLRSWDDANAVAGSTGRIALGPQVATLQQIKRDVEADPWPECAARFKQTTVHAMDKTINGYLAFMRGSFSTSGSQEMGEAKAAWGAWNIELKQL